MYLWIFADCTQIKIQTLQNLYDAVNEWVFNNKKEITLCF